MSMRNTKQFVFFHSSTLYQGFIKDMFCFAFCSVKSSDYDSSSDVGEGSNGDFHIIDKLDEVFREAVS